MNNFELLNTGANVSLEINGNNLVISVTAYAVAANGNTYAITKEPGGEYGNIQTAVDAIQTAANGADCTIQFGNGTDVLDIGMGYVRFQNATGETWDVITLTGKITVNSLRILSSILITSQADISNNNASSGQCMIDNSGTLTIADGTVNSSSTQYFTTISNYGTLTILGGTVSYTGTSGYAIHNGYDGATLTISGGTVSSTTSSAVVNMDSISTVIIENGATIIPHNGLSGEGIIDNRQ